MRRIQRRARRTHDGSKNVAISSILLRWHRRNGRELPWRNENDPYRILVSEIMLQQTQVSRVLIKYPQFLKVFPTFKRLARAKVSQVIKAWRGMGYNNRALRLQAIARVVTDTKKGKLPSTIPELMDLPGIGRYTAHAVACFAFGQKVPLVDTNVNRVLRRLHPSAGSTDIWSLAKHHLHRTSAHDWNQALMDLGATICTASNPKCAICPLSGSCPSAHKTLRRVSQRSRQEPGRDGIPNRIYRGRIVEALRDLKPGYWMTTRQLARKIKIDFDRRDGRWLDSLLGNLERDGLIRKRGRARISLPD